MLRTAELDELLLHSENERVEFKEARATFNERDLSRYMSALANEGGGRLILGVSNQPPRRVVGTSAFPSLNDIKLRLLSRLHIRIDAYELNHADGRVVVFEAPPRPTGMPVAVEGGAWMRSGESLVAMTADMLSRIASEAVLDVSAEICTQASMHDLDPQGIATFRRLWRLRRPDLNIDRLDDDQLLVDAELLVDGGITYAALILMGTAHALARHLANAELIFEYRSAETSIAFQQRHEHRQGIILMIDVLWRQIDARNEVFRITDGMYARDIPMFNELVVREALLNALSHRDYANGDSIFVRQYPNRLEIVSPGGLPRGVTTENMLWKHSPRNRRLAEALTRCGLVERSGQGVDRMFELTITEGKGRPDYSATDDYSVSLALRGEVPDLRFLRFLEASAHDSGSAFAVEDLLIIDLIHREQPIPANLTGHISALRDRGVIEVLGRGRHARYLLSRRFYDYIGKPGSYTHRRGLDRAANKALLLQHLRANPLLGCPLSELVAVLPALDKSQIRVLLRELYAEKQAHVRGRTRAGRWFPGSAPQDESNRDVDF